MGLSPEVATRPVLKSFWTTVYLSRLIITLHVDDEDDNKVKFGLV